MEKPVNHQIEFFKYLKRRRSSEEILYAIQSLLNVRKGAAYKRMNGDTLLSVNEMVTIADHFRISLDTAIGSDRFMSIEHPFTSHSSGIDFLDRYAFYLKPLTDSDIDSSLIYLANELPVFYYFSHSHIFSFLLSVWDHLHWKEDRLNIKKNERITPQLEKLRKQVANYYDSHPVTEIWNSNMLSNLYQQILFCITIRAFDDPRFIASLIEDIRQLLNSMEKMTNIRSDESKTQRNIYLNEFGNFQNLALYKSPKMKVTFIGYDMPHFVVSYNERFHNFSSEWTDKIKKRSILISSEGYQFRELFFIKMKNEFQDFQERIHKLMAVYYDI